MELVVLVLNCYCYCYCYCYCARLLCPSFQALVTLWGSERPLDYAILLSDPVRLPRKNRIPERLISTAPQLLRDIHQHFSSRQNCLTWLSSLPDRMFREKLTPNLECSLS